MNATGPAAAACAAAAARAAAPRMTASRATRAPHLSSAGSAPRPPPACCPVASASQQRGAGPLGASEPSSGAPRWWRTRLCQRRLALLLLIGLRAEHRPAAGTGMDGMGVHARQAARRVLTSVCGACGAADALPPAAPVPVHRAATPTCPWRTRGLRVWPRGPARGNQTARQANRGTPPDGGALRDSPPGSFVCRDTVPASAASSQRTRARCRFR